MNERCIRLRYVQKGRRTRTGAGTTAGRAGLEYAEDEEEAEDLYVYIRVIWQVAIGEH